MEMEIRQEEGSGRENRKLVLVKPFLFSSLKVEKPRGVLCLDDK